MRSFLSFALPALAVGIGIGFLAGRATAPEPLVRQVSQDTRMGEEPDDDDDQDIVGLTGKDYRRIAHLCVAEANRACGARGDTGGASRPNDDTSLDHSLQLRSNLTDLEALSVDQGTWSHNAGIKARMILRRLPAVEASLLRKRIDQAVDEGRLTIEAEAWVPP